MVSHLGDDLGMTMVVEALRFFLKIMFVSVKLGRYTWKIPLKMSP